MVQLGRHFGTGPASLAEIAAEEAIAGLAQPELTIAVWPWLLTMLAFLVIVFARPANHVHVLAARVFGHLHVATFQQPGHRLLHRLAGLGQAGSGEARPDAAGDGPGP